MLQKERRVKSCAGLLFAGSSCLLLRDLPRQLICEAWIAFIHVPGNRTVRVLASG